MNKCSELMTKNPSFCLLIDPVVKAAELMKTEDVGSLPIVGDSESKTLVGILTDRDVALRIVAEGRDAKTRIEDVMTRDLVTCRAEDNVQKALDTMARHQVRRIPVVDEDGRLVGIIAQADVATRIKAPKKTAQLLEGISKRKAARQSA